MFYMVDDDLHYDMHKDFPTAAEALAEIRRRMDMLWNHDDNEPPCGWDKCERRFCIYECEEGHDHYFEEWRRKVHVCTVSGEGLVWENGFEAELARWLVEP